MSPPFPQWGWLSSTWGNLRQRRLSALLLPPSAFGLTPSICGLLLALCLTLGPSLGQAQGIGFRVQSEAQVTLSLAQEADEAIDRAQRWLRAQPSPTNDMARLLLRRYALAMPGKPFRLAKCDLTPLEHAMPATLAPEALTDLTAAIALRRDSPKALFALQRDLPSANPPPDWRERLVTHFVNSQQVSAQGGHWGDAEGTVWAILALRALLNESVPVTLSPCPPPAGAQKTEGGRGETSHTHP